jgi:hypothetical protein
MVTACCTFIQRILKLYNFVIWSSIHTRASSHILLLHDSRCHTMQESIPFHMFITTLYFACVLFCLQQTIAWLHIQSACLTNTLWVEQEICWYVKWHNWFFSEQKYEILPFEPRIFYGWWTLAFCGQMHCTWTTYSLYKFITYTYLNYKNVSEVAWLLTSSTLRYQKNWPYPY